jgi:recombinational DNA repair protein (RecF pathway)
MEVTVNLTTCRACHHSDHSGGFTIRGARVICGHSDACEVRRTREDLAKEYPEYVKDYAKASWRHHWYNRVTDGVIPEWCPLKHGSKY